MNTKAFFADPQAPVRTTWAVIGFFIFCGFGFGGWMSYLTFKIEVMSEQLTETRADVKALREEKSVSKHP